MITTDCILGVQDGKLYCDTHKDIHTIEPWEKHKGHRTEHIPMRHVLYVAYHCTQCPESGILIDEDQ